MKCERCHKDVDTLSFVHKLRRDNVFSKDYSDTNKYAYMCGRCRRVYLAGKMLFVGFWALLVFFSARNGERFYLFLIAVFLVGVSALRFDKIMAWFHGKPYIKKDPESGEDVGRNDS